MNDESVRERIIQKAVELFSEKGFHGTSMRDIAGASECSLPTLYYHYKSKNELFEEIVINRFLHITEMMNKRIDFTASAEEIYLQVYRSRKELQGFDRDVYKMALKVWLGFEGSGKARESVTQWEEGRAAANKRLMQKAVTDPEMCEDVTEILINYMENIIDRTILMDQRLDEEKIRRQIALILKIGN